MQILHGVAISSGKEPCPSEAPPQARFWASRGHHGHNDEGWLVLLGNLCLCGPVLMLFFQSLERSLSGFEDHAAALLIESLGRQGRTASYGGWASLYCHCTFPFPHGHQRTPFTPKASHNLNVQIHTESTNRYDFLHSFASNEH